MGFFAIAAQTETARLDVQRCHLNFWFVPRSLLPQSNFLDVGVLFKCAAVSAESTTLRFLLPFGTRDDGCVDLSEHMLSQSTAEMILGEPVAISGFLVSAKSYGDPFRIVPFVNGECRRQRELSGADFSMWELTVHNVDCTQLLYVRVRFWIDSPGRTWTWRPSVLRRRGALIDLRASDVRGIAVQTWKGLESRLASIPYLNIVVVADVSLRPRASSPVPRSVRLLEPDRWRSYLGRKCRHVLAIYHWREKDAPVNASRPFQAFLDLEKAPDSIFLNAVRTGIMVFVLILSVSAAFGTMPPWAMQLWTWITSASKKTKAVFAAAGVSVFDVLTGLGIARLGKEWISRRLRQLLSGRG